MEPDNRQPTLPFTGPEHHPEPRQMSGDITDSETAATTDGGATTPRPQREASEPTPVGSRSPNRSGVSRPVPASLLAFAECWKVGSPAEAMATACADLRERSAQHTSPIGLTPMLTQLHATRTMSDMQPHGRLKAQKTGWTVHTRTDIPWRRRRFTEAHEIGHILLYKTLATSPQHLADLQSAQSWRQVERLCDYAAAELLMPADDLATRLQRQPVTSTADLNVLYDRYLVSVLALLRRITEVAPRTALTTWKYRRHHHGTDWRIQDSYCTIDGIYFPADMSRRHLAPDLIGRALGEGSASSPTATLDVGGRRYTGMMVALYPLHRDQVELPLFHGRPVGDDIPTDTVYMLHQQLVSSPIRRSGTSRRPAG